MPKLTNDLYKQVIIMENNKNSKESQKRCGFLRLGFSEFYWMSVSCQPYLTHNNLLRMSKMKDQTIKKAVETFYQIFRYESLKMTCFLCRIQYLGLVAI